MFAWHFETFHFISDKCFKMQKFMYSYRVYKHGEMYFFYAVDLKYY